MQRPPTKYVANIPQTPTKHYVRRRGRFIAPVSWHYQIHISISPNTHLNIIKYIYPFHRIRVFTLLNIYIHFTEYVFSHYWIYTFISSNTHFRPPFRGCIHIRGHDKSVPYGCLWFAITLRTDCQNIANGLLIMQRPPTKCVANIPWMCSERIANAWRIRICGHDKSAPTAACGLPLRCWRSAKTLRTDC